LATCKRKRLYGRPNQEARWHPGDPLDGHPMDHDGAPAWLATVKRI
jgi:hypothetical protein